MSQRVTEQEVRDIFETDISDLTPFITAANLTVTDNLSNQGLSDDQLKEIERWLTAHLATARDPRTSKESLGDASETYQGDSGLGLDSSRYGQMVKMLDTSGKLANLGKAKASMRFL